MRLYTFPLTVIVFFLHFALIAETANTEAADEAAVRDFFNRSGPDGASESSHTNNWAVLVCASRYWFNYRVRVAGILCLAFT
jgi:phosphatidylinositol glycan class K